MNSGSDNQSPVLDEIRGELARLDAEEIRVRLDDEFEPKAGALVRVDYGSAYWHLLPHELLELLRQTPTGAGAEGVHRAIEKGASTVWHGPSPPGSRDTSP